MGVARIAKKAVIPITRTVNADPMNDRSTVAIDNRLNGTPQAQPRRTGAANPTSTAAMSVKLMG
jgi:hypothetical protein